MSEIEPVFREALAFHEAFRRLGFPPDDIFVRFSQTGEKMALLQVVAKQADRVFCCDAGVTENLEDLEGRWEKAVVFWNREATEAERREIWHASFVLKRGALFVSALVTRGFQIKKSDKVFHPDVS